jgi:hypothetical protein
MTFVGVGAGTVIAQQPAQKPPANPVPTSMIPPVSTAKPKPLGRTPDGQPDVQGVWGNAEQGTWTLQIENANYLYNVVGMTPLGNTNRKEKSTGGPFTKRSTAIIDPPDGIIPYQPWALERRNSVLKNYQSPQPWQVDTQTPGWPSGIPRENAYSSTDGFYGGPIHILQPKGYVVFLYETHHEFRIVPLDGRPQPGQDIKLWEGSSRGRWEGNTLVIDVKNNSDSPRMSVIGDFRSDQMTAQERWTFVDSENITYRVTVTDPKVLTRPWTMEMYYKRAPAGAELMEYAGVEGAAPFFGFEREGDSRNHIKGKDHK